ncbi:hypothetical protein GCM10020367_41170 [Streptomyces sannanensis]|uniref:MFS transporter n=1 Tax=Streptomyces sannanensis TaxID=285536 RepID=A0ABP6SF80_9ACTN
MADTGSGTGRGADAFSYAQMVRVVPQAGSTFAYASHVLVPVLGAAVTIAVIVEASPTARAGMVVPALRWGEQRGSW